LKPLLTRRLIIRNWEPRDADIFHLINSDDRVMEFFPFRRDRAQSDALLETLRARIEEKSFGFAALEIRGTGECIGFCGLHADSVAATLPPDSIEIGWRLAPQYWGHGFVTEAAEAWLTHGFETMSLDEIVSFAVWNNSRSTAVMERLGMRRDPSGDFDHPRVPDTHPHLKRHVLYRLAKRDWLKRKRAE
jgi:RimJ/RimL family protein N-acetyltransferase